MQSIKAFSFPATNICSSKRFIFGHKQALDKKEIQTISSNNVEWLNKDGVYCVMIIGKDNEPIGGMRIEKLNKSRKVPIQNISNGLTKRVNEYINSFSTEESIAEFCALWTHPQYRTNHLATEIGKLALAKSYNLNINNLILTERLSKSISNRIGFSISNKLMLNDVYFLYPSPKHKTVVREIIDLERHLNIDFYKCNNNLYQLKETYEQIKTYILNPIGTTILESGNNTIQMSYNILE